MPRVPKFELSRQATALLEQGQAQVQVPFRQLEVDGPAKRRSLPSLPPITQPVLPCDSSGTGPPCSPAQPLRAQSRKPVKRSYGGIGRRIHRKPELVDTQAWSFPERKLFKARQGEQRLIFLKLCWAGNALALTWGWLLWQFDGRALCRNSACGVVYLRSKGQILSLLAWTRDVVGPMEMGNGNSCRLPCFQSLRRPLPAVWITAVPGGIQGWM